MTSLTHWLGLTHLQTVKPLKLRAWLDQGRSCESLFQASLAELAQAQFTDAEINKIKSIDWLLVEKEQIWYETHAAVITLEDPLYPPLLKELADPPLVLYVSGDPRLLSATQLGMVGTRQPSPSGRMTAQKFAKELATQGIVVTSGLAAGIDGLCHEGALEAKGKTIAVMGTGLNHIYPRMHARLAEKIRETGALVSEFPLHAGPSAWHFPRRNRVLSGLSLGVVVVEAALRSGSLITARFAMEQNREVFAIPGSIHNPQARGCHQLIRQGVKLVEAVEDIIEELGPLAAFACTKAIGSKTALPSAALNPALQALLNQVDFSVTAFDSIVLRSALTAREVSSMLLLLELKGYIQSIPGGYSRCV